MIDNKEINIRLLDENTYECIENIEFKLIYNNEIIEQKKTNNLGIINFKNLNNGSYQLIEVNNVNNYIKLDIELNNVTPKYNNDIYYIKNNLVYNNNNNNNFSPLTNHSIIIYLKDENKKGISDTEYAILTLDHEYIMSGLTNELGRIEFVNVEIGKYIIKEIKSKSNYHPILKDIIVEIINESSNVILNLHTFKLN